MSNLSPITINSQNPMETYQKYAGSEEPAYKRIRTLFQQAYLGNDAPFFLMYFLFIGVGFLAAGCTFLGSRQLSIFSKGYIPVGTVVTITGLALAAMYYRSDTHKAHRAILADKDGTLINDLYRQGRRDELNAAIDKIQKEQDELQRLKEGELERKMQENEEKAQNYRIELAQLKSGLQSTPESAA